MQKDVALQAGFAVLPLCFSRILIETGQARNHSCKPSSLWYSIPWLVLVSLRAHTYINNQMFDGNYQTRRPVKPPTTQSPGCHRGRSRYLLEQSRRQQEEQQELAKKTTAARLIQHLYRGYLRLGSEEGSVLLARIRLLALLKQLLPLCRPIEFSFQLLVSL